jgi:hypothetical protein
VRVREWIASRAPRAPQALTARLLAALDSDADAPDARTAEVCLAAATRTLETLLAENRFGRGAAIDLLAIDALTTLAFEHASLHADTEDQIMTLAKESARTLGQLTAQRV